MSALSDITKTPKFAKYTVFNLHIRSGRNKSTEIQHGWGLESILLLQRASSSDPFGHTKKKICFLFGGFRSWEVGKQQHQRVSCKKLCIH